MKQRPILGISAYYHDSAAVLLDGGRIVAAAQEERFSRVRHDAAFPRNAVRYVLSEGGCALDDLAAVAFYDKPFLKFERLLETHHAVAPGGLGAFLAAMPVWVKEKLFTKSLLYRELCDATGEQPSRRPALFFPEHHLSHSASAYFASPFESAAILTVDGVGEWATTTLGMGEQGRITLLKELHFPHSLGLLYSAFTYYCGFAVNSGEYKLMGLAPYGNPQGDTFRRYKALIYENLVDLRPDGSFLLNMNFFDFAAGSRMCNDRKWEKLFGIPRRLPEAGLSRDYMNMALAIQQVTEEIVLRLAKTLKTITGAKNLVMAGGVALNCVANGRLLQSGLFDQVWIQPAAGDAGGALGAAYAAYCIKGGKALPVITDGTDRMEGALLGPAFYSENVRRMAKKFGAVYERYDSMDDLCGVVARRLAAGQVVGWFQGRMEWGPRALGNRSILADPRDPGMQRRLNLKIKFREPFRPFAPAVLAEDATEWFALEAPSPYMLLTAPVKPSRRRPVPDNEVALTLQERLAVPRSEIPAVTHVDFSARVQTVDGKTNERFHRLLCAFKQETGCPVLINTSFNVRGEPIVCTPAEAYACFMQTGMDCLVIENFLFEKTGQPCFVKETPNEKPML
ncbi:carbamoyltransferase family protein [Desulfosudis oleivorans]|uniref:Carbamoyltransferase n=1 Tax=Desulfosudis oleivorans (strain DSM 6200 / JCM 39069 / Hxd3) TaxID=96561 RepID=A8ZWI0_DESOH|nr:carbamoyltransferase [Desulfosudis oleivorans]ABW66788.1 Carbamoyltransferase [Desulfosudis oleivorans Hxd3]